MLLYPNPKESFSVHGYNAPTLLLFLIRDAYIVSYKWNAEIDKVKQLTSKSDIEHNICYNAISDSATQCWIRFKTQIPISEKLSLKRIAVISFDFEIEANRKTYLSTKDRKKLKFCNTALKSGAIHKILQHFFQFNTNFSYMSNFPHVQSPFCK